MPSVDNKYDKRYYKYPCCDSFHVCSVLSKKHCTIVVLHFLISNYSKYVKLEKYCLFSFIVLKIILGIKNNSTL